MARSLQQAEQLLIFGGIAVAAYFLWPTIKAALNAAKAGADVSNAAATGISAAAGQVSKGATYVATGQAGSDLVDAVAGPGYAGQRTTNPATAVTGSGSAQFAQNVFVIDTAGNMSNVVPLAQAQQMVATGNYIWQQNPALGYYDRIAPAVNFNIGAASGGSLAFLGIPTG